MSLARIKKPIHWAFSFQSKPSIESKVLAFVLAFKNEYHRLHACLRQASAQGMGKLSETSEWGKVEIVHSELVI